MSSRRRTHNSTWKTITVLDDDGNLERVFYLDERGRLIEGQVPRAPRRVFNYHENREAEVVMPPPIPMNRARAPPKLRHKIDDENLYHAVPKKSNK